MSCTIECWAPSGQTARGVTIVLARSKISEVSNPSGTTLAEDENRPSIYVGTVSESLAEGWYTASVLIDGQGIGGGDVYIVDGETCMVRDHDPAVDADTIQAAAAAAIAEAGLATAGGAFTQTVTVTSSSVAVPNATVEIWSGSVLIDTRTTDSSGVAAPTCDAGSYTLRVICAGYVSSSTAITVTADAARAVALTAIGVVPPSATESQCNAYGYVYDENGDAEASVNIVCELTRMPSGSALIGEDATRTETSGAGGLVTFAQLWIGGTYRFYRSGSSKRFAVTIDASDVDDQGRYPLPNFVG